VKQTRPSNGTTLAQIMESQVAWSGTHTQSDRHNFLVLARHFGIPADQLVFQDGDLAKRYIRSAKVQSERCDFALRLSVGRGATTGVRGARGALGRVRCVT
jgi:hypothetical protein